MNATVRLIGGDEALHPVRVAALRSIRGVPGSDAESKLFARRQRIRSALLIHDWLAAMPVGSLEEVDEVNPEGLFGLAHLPVLTAAVLVQLLAEPAHLVCHGLVGGRSRALSRDRTRLDPRPESRGARRPQPGRPAVTKVGLAVLTRLAGG